MSTRQGRKLVVLHCISQADEVGTGLDRWPPVAQPAHSFVRAASRTPDGKVNPEVAWLYLASCCVVDPPRAPDSR